MANTFTLHIPVSKVESVRAAAKAQGIDLTQNTGTLPESHGVILEYVVNDSDGDTYITLTVKQKPFVVSVGMIEGRVKELLGL